MKIFLLFVQALLCLYAQNIDQCKQDSFMNGSFLTNCQEPNIRDQQVSVSPGLKFGCISVKKIYWGMVDGEVQGSSDQLIWREFFYTMSANNPFYGEMKRNPICINIPW